MSSSLVGRFLMSCPECGTVVERWYTEISSGEEKDEHCPNCDEWEAFNYVMAVADSSTGPEGSE